MNQMRKQNNRNSLCFGRCSFSLLNRRIWIALNLYLYTRTTPHQCNCHNIIYTDTHTPYMYECTYNKCVTNVNVLSLNSLFVCCYFSMPLTHSLPYSQSNPSPIQYTYIYLHQIMKKNMLLVE